MRYVLKHERNLISLGRLESKGCTFKASSRLLKIIRGNMMLMTGKRSGSNLYVVQVESGFLGHIDNSCKSPMKLTFVINVRIGLEGEIVEAKVNSHDISDEFDHLIAHPLACTLLSEDVSGMRCGRIIFGSLDEVIIGDCISCFDEGYIVLKTGIEGYPD